MTFDQWLAAGQTAGYCSAPVCNTHDGLPSAGRAEDERWENGEDPCVLAVRLYPPA